MKILQINIDYKQGSTGNIMYNIHKILNENEFESFVAYGRGDWDEDNVIKISNKFDFYLHALGTRVFDRHGLYSTRVTKNFIEKIDKLDIDVFHLHNIHGYYINYKILFNYLKKKNKPVVWTFHDCWAFTGHCSHYEYVGCDKWQDHCGSCPQKNRYPKSVLFDNSYNNFELKKKYFTSIKNLTIITPSNWLKNEVKKSFFKNYDIQVIHNGIDLEVFKPRKSDFRKKFNIENKFIILGVANVWEERKGFDYFIKLSKMLQNNEVIVLVGLNDKQLKYLPKNVIGIKRTNNLEELVEIYSSADVFVNPTLEEVLGLTNIESLACGTPVITFDSGGSPECLDEKCGYIVKKGDLGELYNKMLEVKNKSKSYFSKHCLKRANLFDKNDKFMEYVKLYKDLT